ncbi:SMI1/KNR4 family protein [Massilia violaceinigra]|uniref:SMI1/KNR4 family protein n=1 Tax=Massilia violaceinigra TaxID=2045208 RepID=A0ABY4AE13_9BURK|nr:SMI1/KNR4 family protein [Massilia violaceinigra]UOD33033.1 SMI1/KNR4 family protein [Massilia violaceinigra]
MTIHPSIARIHAKLEALRLADPQLALFGASSHEYLLAPVKTPAEVSEFEREHSIVLPDDYRQYLLHVGNGGAGPFYGMLPLTASGAAGLLSTAFPMSGAWNMTYEGDPGDKDAYMRWEAVYSDDKWRCGLLTICDFGCGDDVCLVVTGEEYGHVWMDDRCCDGGIHPDTAFGQSGRITFLAWYELWLDTSLRQTGQAGMTDR